MIWVEVGSHTVKNQNGCISPFWENEETKILRLRPVFPPFFSVLPLHPMMLEQIQILRNISIYLCPVEDRCDGSFSEVGEKQKS